MSWQAPANFQQLARRLPVFCCTNPWRVVEYQYQVSSIEPGRPRLFRVHARRSIRCVTCRRWSGLDENGGPHGPGRFTAIFPTDRRVVSRCLRRAHGRAAGGMARHRGGKAGAGQRAHGHGQDAVRLPGLYRPVKRDGAGRAAEGGAVPDLRVPLKVAGRGYPGESAKAPRRNRPGGGAAGNPGGAAHRGHSAEGPAADGEAPAPHPDHHAGVPVPHADLADGPLGA